MRKIPGIIFHWPAWNRSTVDSNRGGLAKSKIFNEHVNGRGWKAIGYHYIINLDVNGEAQIYDGRPDSWRGAHTYGPGNDYLGVSVIYPMDGPLDDKLVDKAIELVAELSKKYGFKINRKNIGGHRDYMPNQCCGDKLYSNLYRIITESAALDTEKKTVPASQDQGDGPKDEAQIKPIKIMLNGTLDSGLLINSQGFIHVSKLQSIGVSVVWDDENKQIILENGDN